MDWDAFHIRDDQPMSAKAPIESSEREITKVFVIDRVELTMIEHILDVGCLNDGNPRRLQDGPNPFDKPIQIRYVGQNIVCMENISYNPSFANWAANSDVKNSSRVGMPCCSVATRATLRAGSIPRTCTPRAV